MAQASAAPPTGRPATVEEVISAIAKQHQIAPALALAVARKESGMNLGAIGDQGQAIGLFQMHSGAAQDTGTADRNDPIQNITGGIRYLKQLNERYKGDVNKVLQAYNGGMDNVDKGTVSPAAQAYAAEVLATLSQGLRERTAQTQTQMPASTPPPAAATARMIPPSTIAGDPERRTPAARESAALADFPGAAAASTGRFLSALGKSAVVDPLMGLASMAGTAMTEGPAATAKQFGTAIIEPMVSGAEKATTARQEGRPLDWVKEMVGAIPLYGPMLRDAGEMAAGGDVAGAAGTAIGGLVPIRGVKRTTPGAIRQPIAAAAEASARNSMTKLFMAAGDGSKAAERAIQQVIPLALDQTLMRVTRGRWARNVEDAKAAIGKQVGRVIASPVGDEIIPTGPVINALDDLESVVSNFVPVNAQGQAIGAAGRGATGLKAVAYNKQLVAQIQKHREIIKEHGPTVHVRQLVNLRRDWDDFVYASKSWLNREDMIKQYEARAKSAATDAVRGIIDQDPRLITLADLDKAYHLHAQLYSFIADESFGRGHGVPYYPGFGLQSAIVRRMFDAAIKSPTWKLMSIATRKRLADAMASNNTTATRNILRGVLGGGTAAVGRETSEDDLLQAKQDNELTLQTDLANARQ